MRPQGLARLEGVVDVLLPPAHVGSLGFHSRFHRRRRGCAHAARRRSDGDWPDPDRPPPGDGAVGSDAFFSDDFRHLDSANTPADICNLTEQTWTFFTPIILAGARPSGPGGSDLVDGPGARAAFGGLAHALQDFYSHSNWVEDSIAINQPDRMPPPLMPTCDPATFPRGLHTGFFEVGAHHDDPLAGCPPGGPPPGFIECHSTLNKDNWNTARGGIMVPGSNPPIKNVDLAAQLATRATTDLYWQIHDLVAADAGRCAADNLFQADRRQACW